MIDDDWHIESELISLSGASSAKLILVYAIFAWLYELLCICSLRVHHSRRSIICEVEVCVWHFRVFVYMITHLFSPSSPVSAEYRLQSWGSSEMVLFFVVIICNYFYVYIWSLVTSLLYDQYVFSCIFMHFHVPLLLRIFKRFKGASALPRAWALWCCPFMCVGTSITFVPFSHLHIHLILSKYARLTFDDVVRDYGNM